MLKFLMEKGENAQDQASNFSRQIETTGDIQMVKLGRKKNTVTEMEEVIEWFISRFTQSRKESVNLKIGQYKLSKLKDKGKKVKKAEWNIQGIQDNGIYLSYI